jgi:hypothetical protein
MLTDDVLDQSNRRSDLMNEYYNAWYQHTQMNYDIANQPRHTDDSASMGHFGGAAVLGGTYIAAGLMIRSGNPAAIAAGAAILAIPDPVIYAVGYWIFD